MTGISDYISQLLSGGSHSIAGAPGAPITTIAPPQLPYDLQLAQIQRQQAMADALQQQTSQAIPVQSYKGIQAPIPWTAVLAKALEGARAGSKERGATEQLNQLGAQSTADMQKMVQLATGGAVPPAATGAPPAPPPRPMASAPPPSAMPPGAPPPAAPAPSAPMAAPAPGPQAAPPGAAIGPVPNGAPPPDASAGGPPPLIPPAAAQLMMMQGGGPNAQALKATLLPMIMARSKAEQALKAFDLSTLPPYVAAAAQAQAAQGVDPTPLIVKALSPSYSGGNAFVQGPNGPAVVARGNEWHAVDPKTLGIPPEAIRPGQQLLVNANGDRKWVTGTDMASSGRFGQEASLAQTKANIATAASYDRAPRSGIGWIMQAWRKQNPNAGPDEIAQAESGYGGMLALGKGMAAGKPGEVVTSVKNSLSHLNTLRALTQAMDNGDVQIYNSLKNRFKAEFGADLPVQMNAATPMIAGEVVKAVTGGQGGVEDRTVMRDALSTALANHQAAAVIDTQRQLIGRQYYQRKQNYIKQGFTDWDKRYADPNIERELSTLVPDAEGAGGGGGAPGGGASLKIDINGKPL